MPWPRSGTFGISDNPMVLNPYVENNSPGEGSLSFALFLLLNGGLFNLLGGGFLLLL